MRSGRSGWTRRCSSGALAVALLAALLAFALVAVTFNTIRLQILTRREEIEVAKLIGATDAFIRRPFLYYGALQGLRRRAGGLADRGGWPSWLLNRELGRAVARSMRPVRASAPEPADSRAAGLRGRAGLAGRWLSVGRHLADRVELVT